MRIARESVPVVVTLGGAVVILAAAGLMSHVQILLFLAALCAVAFLCVALFFRDPERRIPADPKLILSPADGTIVAITEDNEPYFIKGRALRVSIFLSLFNVHINRMPSDGTVAYTHHRPGKFFGAYRDKASEDNEQTCIGLDCPDGVRMTVKQIAGFVARRIICRAAPGESYKAGQRFGLICFGSRTDLFLPPGTPLNVKLGDKVKGGSTVVGVKHALSA